MVAYVIYIREQTFDQEELDIYVNSAGPVLEKFPMQFLAANGRLEVLEGPAPEAVTNRRDRRQTCLARSTLIFGNNCK
jgi:uncharacterized protein (DUF1330 family)